MSVRKSVCLSVCLCFGIFELLAAGRVGTKSAILDCRVRRADDRVPEESRDAADKMAESRAAFARAAVARASAHVSRAEERVAILDRACQPRQQRLLLFC